MLKVWAHWHYNDVYHDIKLYLPPILKSPENCEMGSVVINPIFDAPYNVDRNWNKELFENVIDIFLEMNFQVYITGVKQVVMPKIPKKHLSNDKVKTVFDSVSEAMKLISKCSCYVGGDTGLTHFASTVSFSPFRVIALYGNDSPKRDKLVEGKMKNILTETEDHYFYNSFKPKVNKHKKLLYLTQNEFSSNPEVIKTWICENQFIDTSSIIFQPSEKKVKGLLRKSEKTLCILKNGEWNHELDDLLRVSKEITR